jgi:hypothetical protein
MKTLDRIKSEQQARYAIEREYRLAKDKLNNPNKLTIRQTQILMNKYGFDKALVIAKRYNTLKKGR